VNVVHVITRLIIGGAQENTLATVEDQHRLHGDDVTLITGPEEGPEGSLLPRARSGSFRLEVLPEMKRSIHPFRDWAACRGLVRLLDEIRPDIVHTHSSKAGILGRAAATRLKIPVVHTIHGASFHYGQSWLAYRLYVALEKWAARKTDRFISVADAMTETYVAAGIASPERFVTIYSGFDVDPFLSPPRSREEVRGELGFTEEQVVVGKIGRLFPLKGQEFLIRAAPRIVAENPQVRFLLVGDGILREQFQRMIDEAGLREHFVFTGLVPPERIPELLAAMDVVVHTSQWEGLARVLPQALIAGRPVISYDVGGAGEVVIPNETGILLPRDSVEELADAVLRLAADPDRRRRFGAAGRTRCERLFRHETMTEQIREVYAEVLKSRETAFAQDPP
jgi:glycosyltransferase involved in cell wall biosynthesis